MTTTSQYSIPTESDQDISITLSEVGEIVQPHYGEELWQAVKAGIAVIASLSLARRDHCLPLIYEGPSGQGKSVVIRMLMPERNATRKHVIRIDNFTPASFVSHAANISRKKIHEIDLLPKIRDRAMLTKELAPLFGDDEKSLRKNFSTLISVLDGNGYRTASGEHALRGYEGRYLFNWLGATTPIPEHTYKVMAQLGNRILQYEIKGEECTEDDLMDFAQSYGSSDTVKECQKAVNDFIEGHFKRYPVESIDPSSIEIQETFRRQIIRYADLIAHGRVKVEHNKVGLAEAFEATAPEGPRRVILLLQCLVQGLVLAEERDIVTSEDMTMIRHIAFSCIPYKRREVLRALLDAGGVLVADAAEQALGVSRPTVHARMKELAATGIVDFIPGEPSSSIPAQIQTASNWNWLLTGTP